MDGQQEIIPLEKPRRIVDKPYREWIARQYCIFCYLSGYGKNYNGMCCHAYAGGMGTKCDDHLTFTGCDGHHKEYDAGAETMLKKYTGFNIEQYFIEQQTEYVRQTGNKLL